MFESVKDPVFVIYQVLTDRPAYALQGRKVTVCEKENGETIVLLNQTPLMFKPFMRQPKRNSIATSKNIERQSFKPANDPPWRIYAQRINGKPIKLPN